MLAVGAGNDNMIRDSGIADLEILRQGADGAGVDLGNGCTSHQPNRNPTLATVILLAVRPMTLVRIRTDDSPSCELGSSSRIGIKCCVKYCSRSSIWTSGMSDMVDGRPMSRKGQCRLPQSQAHGPSSIQVLEAF